MRIGKTENRITYKTVNTINLRNDFIANNLKFISKVIQLQMVKKNKIVNHSNWAANENYNISKLPFPSRTTSGS